MEDPSGGAAYLLAKVVDGLLLQQADDESQVPSTPLFGVLEVRGFPDKEARKEMLGVVERRMEDHLRGMTEKLGVFYEGVKKGIRGSSFLIQKRWLVALAREAKKDKSQTRMSREAKGIREEEEGGEGEGENERESLCSPYEDHFMECEGFEGGEKRRMVKEMVRSCKVAILCLS